MYADTTKEYKYIQRGIKKKKKPVSFLGNISQS